MACLHSQLCVQVVMIGRRWVMEAASSLSSLARAVVSALHLTQMMEVLSDVHCHRQMMPSYSYALGYLMKLLFGNKC